MTALAHALAEHLEHLKALPFVAEVTVVEWQPEGLAVQPDAVLLVRAQDGKAHRFYVEYKGAIATRAVVHQLAAQAARAPDLPWLLLAPKVTVEQGELLRERGIGYVDAAGNCYVALGTKQVAWIAGRKTARRHLAKERAIRAPGFKIIFALLARPELLRTNVRELAAQAGAGKTAAAEMLRQLADEKVIAERGDGWVLLERKRLQERWLQGYVATLRPKLLVGRFQPMDEDVGQLERRIAGELGDVRWAWGGLAAAYRLDGYYRGDETVIHVDVPFDVTRRLKAPRRADGPLIVLRAPGPAAYADEPERTVHPLLVHAELALAGDPRAHEAAERIHQAYLEVA